MKLLISPFFAGEDKGDGGIRRVVEAQRKHLPDYGIEIVNTEAEADIVAIHAGVWERTYKPVVSHCHGLYWAEYAWPNWCHQLNTDVIDAMRKADVVTAPSKWVAYAIQRGIWIDPVVLYHGIEPEEWAPADVYEGYVLWNKTRVDPICDPSPMNILASLCPNINFKSTFGTAAKNVTITGKLPYEQSKNIIQRAGIYLATTRETFGIGTLEAMASGVPVLGFNWGGQAEFISQGVDGYLVTPGDFAELKNGLEYILNNRERMSVAAREKALTQFTWHKVMADYANLYESVYKRSLEKRPKVSVVVPAYKLADLLPDTIKSIQDQSMTDWECIIVNDNSPDNTQQVAENFAATDARIKVINNPENLYLAGALNTGACAAKGDYIIPVDADNMLGTPDSLQVLSYALDNDRDIDIAYGSMEVINPDGSKFISSWPPSQFSLSAQLSHRNQITSTAMYRKRAWQRVGGYRRRCRTAEDADYWCRLTSFGCHAKKVTDSVVLVYRNRHESMSHNIKDWPWEEWYPWGKISKLTPFGAQTPRNANLTNVPSYEPPLISVIIPVGPGHEQLVVDAVDSIVAQTFTKWEVIVVNDSGKDLPWIHPFVKVITTAGGTGPSVARNLGIKASRAYSFIPLDADDYLQQNALEQMYKVFAENEGGSYVYTDWIVQETAEGKEAPEYDCKDVLRRLPHAVTALYSKAAWEKVGGFDEVIEAWEDWDFIIALNVFGYCGIRLPLPLIQYRMQAGSRREKMYADKDRLRQVMLDKWGEYITGEKQTMACGGCGGRKVSTNGGSAPRVTRVEVTAPSEGMVLIEYTKQNAGTVTYIGQVTGTVYRFGSDQGHRVKYVYKEDAETFLTRSEFRIYQEVITNVLQAAGPPKR